MPRLPLFLLLLLCGPLLPTTRADEATRMMAPSSVPPPVSLGGAPNLPVHGDSSTNQNDDNINNNNKDTNAGETVVAPSVALEARFPSIYGPFIPSRDALPLKGPQPGAVVNPKGPPADKAGQRGYVYTPTGPQGWYENDPGSNYYSAYPYPPDPYLADGQYYNDFGWDHVHEFPFVYVSRKDTAPLIEFVELMGRGRDNGEAGKAADEAQAAKDEASSSGSSSGSGAEASLGVDKQYGGGYGGGYPGSGGYGGGGYPYGGGYDGYGYPSYYSAGFGGYFTKGRKGGGFYAGFGGGGYGGYPGYYGGCGGGGYGCGGGYYRRRLRGAVGE